MAKIIITKPEAASRAAELSRLRKELREKLRSYNFTHFITLASNHQDISQGCMRSLLKDWDARVNADLPLPTRMLDVFHARSMTPFVAEFVAQLVADTHEIKGFFRVQRVRRGWVRGWTSTQAGLVAAASFRT